MEWIDITEEKPPIRKDFQTMMESQYISKKLTFLTDPKHWTDNLTGEKATEPFEIEGYYVELTQQGKPTEQLVTFHPTGTQNYVKLGVITHWKKE